MAGSTLFCNHPSAGLNPLMSAGVWKPSMELLSRGRRDSIKPQTFEMGPVNRGQRQGCQGSSLRRWHS